MINLVAIIIIVFFSVGMGVQWKREFGKLNMAFWVWILCIVIPMIAINLVMWITP